MLWLPSSLLFNYRAQSINCTFEAGYMDVGNVLDAQDWVGEENQNFTHNFPGVQLCSAMADSASVSAQPLLKLKPCFPSRFTSFHQPSKNRAFMSSTAASGDPSPRTRFSVHPSSP